ncbi:hypothetical protein VdG1_05396 [Verticillium dahliae VDG1]|nr:hypothetical protein VdG1_05396 [Verticillium dahliae VDG1]
MARQKEEKDGKGKMGFMQKYYHKGVFFSDEAAAAGLDKRDLAGARFADEIKDRSVLPEYLQKRDMTKLGRKGGTKYKDLREIVKSAGTGAGTGVTATAGETAAVMTTDGGTGRAQDHHGGGETRVTTVTGGNAVRRKIATAITRVTSGAG